VAQRRVAQAGPNTAYIENFHGRLVDTLGYRHRSKYELGRLLDEAITGDYWSREDYPGVPEGGYPKNREGFKRWCREIIGYQYRTVQYLCSNYRKLSALGLDEHGETFKGAINMGWSRLLHVLRVAHDEATLDHWVQRVRDEGMGEAELRGEVEIALGSGEELDEEDEPQPEPEKKPSRTRGSTGKPRSREPKVDPETGEELDPPGIAEDDGCQVDWALRFTNRTALRTWLKALEVVKRRTDTDSNGQAAATMATYYLSHTPAEDEGGLVMELEELLQVIEQTYGVKLDVVLPMPTVAAAPKADPAMEGFGT